MAPSELLLPLLYEPQNKHLRYHASTSQLLLSNGSRSSRACPQIQFTVHPWSLPHHGLKFALCVMPGSGECCASRKWCARLPFHNLLTLPPQQRMRKALGDPPLSSHHLATHKAYLGDKHCGLHSLSRSAASTR